MALKSLEDSLSQHILQPLFTEMDISTSEREESTPKKLGKIINKKWKKKIKRWNHNESYLLSFIDVTGVSYCVSCNRTFLYPIIVPVKLQHHFKTHHLEFKEKGIEYFKCTHHELFQSQNLF